jgi:glycosyltransferase involved in cell wall biosynthesis
VNVSEPTARKVAFLITEFGRGGAETQILRLAIGLKQRGWAPSVISMMPAVGYFEELAEANIPLDTLGMTRGIPDPRGLAELVRLLRQRRPDVLASFCFHANVLGPVAGRLAGVPVIVSSIRGERFGSRNRERIERALTQLRFRDVLTTNSELVAQSLVARKIASAGRTIVIPNGIVSQVYRTQTGLRTRLRSELGLDDDAFFWLAVGNVRLPKDYPNLLRAFRMLRQERPEARLKIAGDVREPLAMAQFHAALDSRDADAVELLGSREDIPALLAAADALVLSSAHEGLPNVVMEALAAGLPVVATDVGGVRELVEPDVSGFVVPAQDAQRLYEAMDRMMACDGERRQVMGARGQAHIEAHFDLLRVTQRWEDLFENLLASKRAR